MNNIARYLHDAALRYPSNVAVKCEGQALSYAEFDGLIGRLRRFIESQPGCVPGATAAVLAYKSTAAVAFAQAALRCGLAYTVVDPRYPDQRIADILKDSRPAVLFTDFSGARLQAIASESHIPPTVFAQADKALPEHAQLEQIQELEPVLAAPFDTPADAVAYVLYTSGSTGVPKGVRISHANAAFSIDWAQDEFRFDSTEVFLNQAHFGFDFCVLDHYNAWKVGASVVLVPEYDAVFPVHVVDLIREERITNLWLVPSNIVALIKQGGLLGTDSSSVRRFLYGGEPFQMPYLRQVCAWMAGRPVYNLYGPTETNLVTSRRVTPEDLAGEEVPLGAAIPGVRLMVTTEAGQLESTGMGELWAQAPSVALGYTNRPDLNESRFRNLDGQAWYRTGDIVNIDPQGVAWYRGRVDDMVKVRGFRIELKEVEKAMLTLPGMAEAALVVHAPAGGEKEIHAFCVSQGPAEREIRRHLAQKLPPFMVPKYFHLVQDIPYNDRGKVNKTALRERLAS